MHACLPSKEAVPLKFEGTWPKVSCTTMHYTWPGKNYPVEVAQVASSTQHVHRKNLSREPQVIGHSKAVLGFAATIGGAWKILNLVSRQTTPISTASSSSTLR